MLVKMQGEPHARHSPLSALQLYYHAVVEGYPWHGQSYSVLDPTHQLTSKRDNSRKTHILHFAPDGPEPHLSNCLSKIRVWPNQRGRPAAYRYPREPSWPFRPRPHARMLRVQWHCENAEYYRDEEQGCCVSQGGIQYRGCLY